MNSLELVRSKKNRDINGIHKYRNIKFQLRKSIRVDRIRRMSNYGINIQMEFINEDFGKVWKIAKRWDKYHVRDRFQESNDLLDRLATQQKDKYQQNTMIKNIFFLQKGYTT